MGEFFPPAALSLLVRLQIALEPRVPVPLYRCLLGRKHAVEKRNGYTEISEPRYSVILTKFEVAS